VNRVIKLERNGRRNGWRAYAADGVPLEYWSDDALESFIAETDAWELGCAPTEEDLRAYASIRMNNNYDEFEDGGGAA
jgi:hypothetical protein